MAVVLEVGIWLVGQIAPFFDGAIIFFGTRRQIGVLLNCK